MRKKVSKSMKVVVIVKGDKLKLLYKDCNMIRILGRFEKVIFINSELDRFIRDFCGSK